MRATPMAPDPRAHNDPLLAIVAAITGSLLFSGKGILTKAGMSLGAESLQMLALRMAFSAPLFGFILIWSLRGKKILPSDFWKAAGLGLLGTWVSPVLNFHGLATVSANLERLLIYACPVMTLLFAFLIGKERMTQKGILALILSYLGVIIAVLGRDGINATADPEGTISILLGCITYSLFVVISVKMQQRMGVLIFTSIALFSSSIITSIHLMIQLGPTALLQPPEGVLPLAIGLAWACTVAPGYLVAYSVAKLGASKSSIVQMVGPLFTPLAAGIVLGEKMSSLQWVGFSFVLIGALFLIQNRKENELE